MKRIKLLLLLLLVLATVTFTKAQIKKDTALAPVYAKVDMMPLFPGGPEAFTRFLGKNIIYPMDARNHGTHGRIVIQFIIEIDGSLSHLEVIHGIGDGCDVEARRVLALSPKWNPGMVNGKKVRTKFSAPITFELSK